MSIKYPIEKPHSFSVEQILSTFQTDSSNGLTESEAINRSKEFGPNIYQTQKRKRIGRMFLDQFRNPIVYLLAFGSIASLYFGDTIEAIAIVAVILINALIGFLMELQARSSMNALREMDVVHTRVLRDGKTLKIPSEKITLGDIIIFEAGDVLPGDGRLIKANQLQCDESSLTGESIATIKNTDDVPEETPIGDQHNMIFKGTSVMNGNGVAVITGIAEHTQLGSITSLVESSTGVVSPLDKKLNGLTKKLIWVTLIMTSIFAITGIIQGKSWHVIIETSIALAVAAIPEGLPIVATVALAYGMLLMARRNVIVKKLSAVETLGSTNVILTDKTGTLTENKIHVNVLSFPGETLSVRIENNILKFDQGSVEKTSENFEKLILIGALCNNASLENEGTKQKTTGDPIEIALIHLVNASGKSFEEIRKQFGRLDEVPFSSETKMMGTLHKVPKGNFAAVKGSVEQLLERCSKIQSANLIRDWKDGEKNEVLLESEKMSAEGLRVLAFAFKEGEIQTKNYLNHLVYVGMIGFLDMPRLDIKDAIVLCRKAGIKIVMITGDHPMTALNIAKRTGLVDEGEKNVITGKDIPSDDALSNEWKKRILSTSIFARTSPKQKLDIAAIYQEAGNVVAMTGDGVNDAPALKKADVGIAMGLRGTGVAKETASIILKDDSFTSIAHAVENGREIFQNIQKFVIYLVSCNLSEILIVTTLGFLAPASTLLPLQILFLNMVTDVFPALALGLGTGDSTVMSKPPRDAAKGIVSNRDWVVITLYSVLMTLFVLLAVLYCKRYITPDAGVGNNVAFVTLTFVQLFHVFNMSSLRSPFLVNEITRNKYVWLAFLICTGLLVLVQVSPPIQIVLKLSVLPKEAWIVSLVASFIPLALIQIYKSIWKGREEKMENTSTHLPLLV
ncbi:cation-transporting P-type ATPase [soil metagenome]